MKKTKRNKEKNNHIDNRFWFTPITIFIVALFIRLVYFWTIKDDPLVQIPILDGLVYTNWAKEIASGNWAAGVPYWTEPGYAYFLTFMGKLAASNVVTIIFQFFLGSLSAMLLYFSGLKLWGKTAGISAGLIYAFCAPAIFYEGTILKTAIELFLICSIILLIIFWWESRKWWQILVMGMTLGLSAIFKANNIAIPLVLFALLVIEQIFNNSNKIKKISLINFKGIIKNSLLIVGVIIVILPLILINYIVGKDLVLINYSAGPNFYIGNWEGSDGSMKVPEFVSFNPETEEISWKKMAEAYTHKSMSPSQVNSFWLIKTMETIIENPSFFIVNTFKKINLIFNQLELADNYDINYAFKLFKPLEWFLPFWVIGVFGLLGLFISINKRKKIYYPLYLIFITYCLSLVLTHISGRYRLALAPVLILFAGYFINWMRIQFVHSDWKKNFKLLIPIIIISLISWIKYPGISSTTAADMNQNFASQYEEKKQVDLAEKYYKKSIENNPDYPIAKVGLARLYLSVGRIDESISYYEKAIAMQPDLSNKELAIAMNAYLHGWDLKIINSKLNDIKQTNKRKEFDYDIDYVEGLSLIRNKKYKSAIPKLEKATEKSNSLDILTNLGVAYRADQKITEATDIYLKILRIDQYNLPAHYNLGNLYAQQKMWKDAASHYDIVLNWVPDYALAGYYLATTYQNQGDFVNALKQYQKFIEDSKENTGKTEYIKKAQKAIDDMQNNIKSQTNK